MTMERICSIGPFLFLDSDVAYTFDSAIKPTNSCLVLYFCASIGQYDMLAIVCGAPTMQDFLRGYADEYKNNALLNFISV